MSKSKEELEAERAEAVDDLAFVANLLWREHPKAKMGWLQDEFLSRMGSLDLVALLQRYHPRLVSDLTRRFLAEHKPLSLARPSPGGAGAEERRAAP